MQVTFNTTFNDQQLAITAIININNINLNNEHFANMRRYFNNITDQFSITTNGLKHTLYIDFASNATINAINDAIDLLAEDLAELA